MSTGSTSSVRSTCSAAFFEWLYTTNTSSIVPFSYPSMAYAATDAASSTVGSAERSVNPSTGSTLR